jgi:hypothetical protein
VNEPASTKANIFNSVAFLAASVLMVTVTAFPTGATESNAPTWSHTQEPKEHTPYAKTDQTPVLAVHVLVAPEYATGTSPKSVAIGDVNNDGIPDLAVANFDDNSVSILLGKGDGSFAEHVDYPTGKGPCAVTFAELNGDRELDLILANTTDGTVSVLQGNGDGTFQVHIDFPAGASPTALAVADFNGDQNLDIAVASEPAGTISVLLGNGKGSFNQPVSFSVDHPTSLATADFNTDGKQDLIVGSNASGCGPGDGWITLFPGMGDGSFQNARAYSINGVLSVAVADLNGDGNADVIAAVCFAATVPGPGEVVVLLGNGAGSFGEPLSYVTDRASTGSTAYVTTGDFDGDGHLDVAVSSSTDNTVSVLLGKGDGTFRSQVNFGAGFAPSSVAAGDLNGDGQIDLVTTNLYGDSVSALLGDGAGRFQARVDYGVGVNPTLAIGDFNGDNKLDIVTGEDQAAKGSGSVLLGNSDGTFAYGKPYVAPGDVLAVITGDFNGDHKLDAALAGFGWVSVSLGSGDGTLQQGPYYGVPYSFPNWLRPIATADFNGDGALDLAVAEGAHVTLLFNTGNGSFKSPVDLGITAQSVISADFNGDGKADLGLAGVPIDSQTQDGIAILLGNGDGTFQAPIYTRTNATDLVAADLNADGKIDLVVGNVLSVLLGNGDGTFLPVGDYIATVNSFAVADIDGEGHPDIIGIDADTSMLEPSQISIFLNNGNGTFQKAFECIAGRNMTSLAIADFNGDGRLDIATASKVDTAIFPFYVDGFVSVLLNGQFSLVGVQSSKNPSLPGEAVSFIVHARPSGPGSAAPSGIVVFQDGNLAVGSATLNGGIATSPPLTLSTGTHQITARYSGDENFRPGSGGTRQVVGVPDFSVVASNLDPASVTAGQSATATFTLTSLAGFAGSVPMLCSVSPAPAQAPSCTLNPSSLQMGKGDALDSMLTVTTTAGTVGALGSRNGGSLLNRFLALWVPLVIFAGCPRRRVFKHPVERLLLVGILLVVTGALLACGGGSQQNARGGTPPGNYTVTVLATSGGSQHAIMLTLTVD